MTAADLRRAIVALQQAEALADPVRALAERKANERDAADWRQLKAHLARGYGPAIAALRGMLREMEGEK